MQLRGYQERALSEVQAGYRSGLRRLLLCAPTGSGKSAMTRYMLGRTTKTTLILAHRAELVEMISASLSMPHGVITAGGKPSHERVRVGMMQTVARRLDTLPRFDWVISDEAHLAMAPTWATILRHYGAAWHLGMSATPCRLDGVGLGTVYERIVYGPDVRELTASGYLVPCRVFAPPLPASGAGGDLGDMSMTAAAHALDKPAITGSAVAHLRRLAPERRTIVFCCSREHAEHVAQEFRAGGFTAAAVDASMSDRAARIADFRAGRVQVLTNVDLLTTGYDDPSIGAAVFLRPTQSLALYLQMIGRILRIHPGKQDAILLDHVGNVLTHGMPTQAREWTLEGKLKRQGPAPVKQCMQCYACHAPAPSCPSCGHVYAVAAKPRVLAQRAGDLAEVTEVKREPVKREDLKRMLRSAKTLGEVLTVAKSLGYSSKWAIMEHKRREKYRRSASA
jgi:DNA repair protein RadD